jgi:hypothetical protein
MLEKTVTIFSSQRLNASSTTSSNFTFPLSSRQTVKSWQLLFADVPLTIFNITSGNNVITFTENSTTKTATLTPGNYNANTLKDEVKRVMDAASSSYNTFTVDVNYTVFGYSFQAANPFQLNCSAALFPYRELGFYTTDTASATQILSTRSYSLDRPHNIIVSINELDNQIITGSFGINGVFVLPVSENLGSVLHFEPEYKIGNTLHNPVNLTTLNIKLLDASGNYVDLNGSDWSMVLKLTVID